MTLQQIVNLYENGLLKGKSKAPEPAKPRRGFYHDIKYVLDFQKTCKSEYDLLFACVFNRDRHLYLLSKTIAVIATDALFNGKVLHGVYSDFETLYDRVRSLLNPIKGLGDVAYYDITVRIGFLLKIYPDNKVYYHVHLRDCARIILGVNRLKSYRCDTALFNALLGVMPSIFIEDFLCSMYNNIKSPTFTFGKLPAHSNLNINYFK